MNYVDKLVAAHPLGYSVVEGQHSVIGSSVVVPVQVTLHLEDAERVSAANGVSPLKDEDGKDVDAGDAVKSAASDGLKRALLKWGVGSHLYHEEAETVGAATKPAPQKANPPVQQNAEEDEAPAPKRRTEPAKVASKGGSDWASKREKFTVPIGKHKGSTYEAVDAGWLQWAVDNLDDNERNAKLLECVNQEIKYRKENGGFNPDAGRKKFNSKPTKKRSIDESDPDDF